LAAVEPGVILVTGGAGYIGSHTSKALRQAGHQVVIFDNLSAGHREAALGAPLIEGDIRDVDAVRRAIRETGATAVMHFAAWLAVADSVHDPVGYYRNNVNGTLGTLEAMALEGCRQFVFSSTCAVYGEPIETPLRETHRTEPINAYGQTKLAVEHALPHFERAYGIRSVRLRYFTPPRDCARSAASPIATEAPAATTTRPARGLLTQLSAAFERRASSARPRVRPAPRSAAIST
jgi:UDP-glucose 4-epimerase